MSTPLDDFLCASCAHKAKDHTAFIGPCAECWRQLDTPEICPRFIIREQDRATIMALDLGPV